MRVTEPARPLPPALHPALSDASRGAKSPRSLCLSVGPRLLVLRRSPARIIVHQRGARSPRSGPAWLPSPTEESRGLVKTASERDDLYELLHPADPIDVPVPGFPSHAALVAWARTRDLERIREAALDTLREDEWPQQYAAMGLLRELGMAVEGEDHGEGFHWIVDPQGRREVVVPRCLPDGPELDETASAQVDALLERAIRRNPATTEVRSGEQELRNLLASAILQLDEVSKIVLALYYFEGLTYEEISVVLGPAISVETVIRNALQQLRDRLTAKKREELRFYLDEALVSGSLRSPTLAFAALLAA